MNKSIVLNKTQQYFAVISSVTISFLVVWAIVSGATTISTNISTGGTLSVTGASTLTGDVSASGAMNVTGPLSASSTVSVSGGLVANGASTTVSGTLDSTGLATFKAGYLATASSTAVAAFNVNGATDLNSTLNVDGLSTLTGYISTASSTAVAAFNVNGLATIKGGLLATASTTVNSGNLTVTGSAGKVGVGTTTPATELSAAGAATTTLYITSSGTGNGGCIQLRGNDGAFYRMYIGSNDTTNYATSTNGHGTFVAVWETGVCK